MRRRLILWSLPCFGFVLGMAALAHVRAMERLDEARALLGAGEAEAAGRVFAELADSFFYASRARAGLRIAEALGARPEVPVSGAEPVDTSPFPLAVYARRAFELGQFEAALELDELAHENGRPTVPLVKTAALIEQGRYGEVDQEDVRGQSVRLARHVRNYLETISETAPAPDGSVVLRDRTGQHLGYLSQEGQLEIANDVRPEWVPRSLPEAIHGYDDATSIRLTLDLELSELAMGALGSYRGSIVLVDPRTGQILAAVSDRKSFAEGGTPAFEERREPASIAKLITAAAAFRAGIDPDAEISRMTCNGHRRYDGELLYCPYIAGPLRGLSRALAVSCNVAFADLGVAVGRRRLVEEFRRWGFEGPPREGSGGETQVEGVFTGGWIVEPRGDERQLADLAIGLEATDVTPLHAALLAAVLANGGVMPSPTLVHALDGRLGFHPRRIPPEPGRPVLEPEWLAPIVSAMEEVARRGTASRIAPYNFPVAMKTGTASHPRWGFHVNYVGIGPMPQPRIAFAVRVTHQRTSRRVRNAAQLVTRRLLRALGRVAEERGWRDGVESVPGRDPIHRLARAEDQGSNRRPSSGGTSGQEPSGRLARR